MKNDPLKIKQKLKFQKLLRNVSHWSDENGFKRVDAQSLLNTRGVEYVRTDLKHLIDDAIRLGYLIPQSEKPPTIMLNISNNHNFGLEMHVRVRPSTSGENLLEWDPSWWGRFINTIKEDSPETAGKLVKFAATDLWGKIILIGILTLLARLTFWNHK